MLIALLALITLSHFYYTLVMKMLKVIKMHNMRGDEPKADTAFKISKASISNAQDLLILRNFLLILNSSVGEVWRELNQPPPFTVLLQCKRSSISICTTPSTDVIRLYPVALRPRLRGDVVIFRTCMASSSLLILAEAAERLARCSRVSRPCTVCAAAIRVLPASVFGPVDRPP